MRVGSQSLPLPVVFAVEHKRRQVMLQQYVRGGAMAGFTIGAGFGWAAYEALLEHPVVAPINAVAIPIISVLSGAFAGYKLATRH